MTTICLPERCDRAVAETLLPEFVAAMGNSPIEVNGEAVTQVGQEAADDDDDDAAAAAGSPDRDDDDDDGPGGEDDDD